ncbi:cation diffusion facilitator CzcD-associated flavoprotein CzcO [Saccharothrix saharensis]|uniref:Cation diffusion facilitator CzcD-associated flavoprotein CzcO n=1 Tax=Saccharothrix saharensis TaxID=571190 RepID=A0A543JNM3_9PSEU|nr:NAD(P)-binding domain-containing protein [Saccharothrix saharensis]TQM84461.1 cation diffusion facilitator CzcD-associated flavoprotein CzcO [Saccharothrix saharensis]
MTGGRDAGVCVVGAGFAGLAVTHELHVRGVPFTWLDRGTGIGGLWSYSAGPAYPSLRLNTSKGPTAFSWAPMPEAYPTHPRHDQVAAYLDACARPFRDRVELRTAVEHVRPHGSGAWDVTTRDHRGATRVRRFAHVVVAAGHHWTPRLPEPPIPGIDSFPGPVVHTLDYHGADPYRGRRVLVLGLGNSACDIAADVSRVATSTVLSARRGAHVVPRRLLGVPWDELRHRWWWTVLPFGARRLLAEAVLHARRGPLTAYGLPEPAERVLTEPLVVSDDLLEHIARGAVTAAPAVRGVDHATVHFADGTSREFDAVVYCTGYRPDTTVVPEEVLCQADGRIALYLRVVPPHRPGLYFAGFVRGVVHPLGALTPVFEAQARWIADLVRGATTTPDLPAMTAEIDAHLARTAHLHGTGPADPLHIDVPRYLRALRDRSGPRRATRAGKVDRSGFVPARAARPPRREGSDRGSHHPA